MPFVKYADHREHMRLIDAVNSATTTLEHQLANARLHGWRDGVKSAGLQWDGCRADMEQFERGIDRPICCGVLLDWNPENPWSPPDDNQECTAM